MYVGFASRNNPLTAAFVLLSMALAFSPASAQSPELATNIRMQKVVQTAVQKLGGQIMILGSWVSGLKYGDPLLGGKSDCDMRLVCSKATSPEIALQEWKNARNTVEQLVRKEFGSKADDVLKVCNLYPPKQLMNGVEGAADALERFKELRQVPALSVTGNITKVTEEVAEGLYGRGASTWTQAYENTAGKLIYSVPVKTSDGKIINQVFRGAADITHLEEGVGLFTAGGMGNTSKQWITHAEDAIKTGAGDKVVKYLERLERDMAKARDLAGLGPTGKWRDEIRALVKQIKADPKAIGLVEGQVKTVLSRAEFAASVLSKMDNRSEGTKLVLSNLIKAADDGRQFASTIKEMAQKVPLDRVLTLLVSAITTYEVARGAGEEDTTRIVLGLADFTATLPAALLARFTNQLLESTKEGGYDMVAGSQQAFDLLDGIYTAAGRQTAEGSQYSIDQLVLKYREGDEEKLKGFVFGLCTKASDRQAGTATGAADTKVADAMHAKVYPVILRAWRNKRMLMMHEVNTLRNDYLNKGIQLVYAPVAAKVDAGTGKVDITFTINTMNGKPADELTKAREILTKLYGSGNYFVKVEDKWSPGGKVGANENQRICTFTNGGTFPVTVKRSLSIGGSGIPSSSYLATTVELRAGVDVEIGGFAVTLAPPTISGMGASLTASVSGLPLAVKKLGYRWNFNDLDSIPDKECPYPVQVWGDGLSPNFEMKSFHTYKKSRNYKVYLDLYDLTKGPFVDFMSRPIAKATVPVNLLQGPTEGNFDIRILLECVEPKKANMPPDWRVPSITTEVQSSGGFNFNKTWRDGGDSFDDFQYSIQGEGSFDPASGILSISMSWRRSRAYVGQTTSKKYNVTQSDTGIVKTTGTYKVSDYGDLNYKQTSSTGSFDSTITFAEPSEEPKVYQCSGGVSPDLIVFKFSRPK